MLTGIEGRSQLIVITWPRRAVETKHREKGSLKCLSYCRITAVYPSESLNLSTNELTCVLGNTDKVDIFNLSCFCSHRTEVSGFLSDLQLQEQWHSTTQQQMNPIVLLIMKSKQEMELLLEQEKWQDFLTQKPHKIQGARCWCSPELRGLISGGTEPKVSRCCGDRHRETSSLVPFLGKAECHWAPAARDWRKQLGNTLVNQQGKEPCWKREFAYF